jgi:hypothetical protein
MGTPLHEIRYPIAIDEGSGRLSLERDSVEHIEQLMKQILLTAPGERINRPTFGCGIKRMLFAPNSVISAQLAQLTVFQALNEWLGTRILVEDVSIVPKEEVLEIYIRYAIRGRAERRVLNLEVTL